MSEDIHSSDNGKSNGTPQRPAQQLMLSVGDPLIAWTEEVEREFWEHFSIKNRK